MHLKSQSSPTENVKATAVACVLAYIATITVILTHCHPLNRLWQVYPYPGSELQMEFQ